MLVLRRSGVSIAIAVVVMATACTASVSSGSGSAATSIASSSSSSTTTPPTSTSSSEPSSSPPPSSTPPAGTAGPLVVLNPGHDGGNSTHTAEINRQVYAGFGEYKACDTTGTETNAGYAEHAFNWDVTLRVAAILRGHGVRVAMTRTSDTGVGPCVDARAATGNRPGVACVVSIHADGAPSSGQGFHVNLDSRRPEGASTAVVARSKQLGTDLHAALVTSSGLVPSTYVGTNGYVYRSDLAGLNLASRPAVFLELGNMRNGHDAALQSSPTGRARIAGAVAAGILRYLDR